jgi:hypothetical protein
VNARALRKHATTIALVLAATGLGVYTLVDRASLTTDEAAARKHSLLPAFRLDDVSELSITSGGTTAHLTRTAPDARGQRGWMIEADGRATPAEVDVVDRLLGTLDAASFDHEVSGKATADPAIVTMTIRLAGKEQHLRIGGSTAQPKDGAYALVDDHTYAISGDLARSLTVDLDTLRDKTIVPYPTADLAGLMIATETTTLRFVRAPWSTSKSSAFRQDDDGPRADSEHLQRVWLALGELRAESFLSDADADRAAKKDVTLTLAPSDAKKAAAVLEIGGACPGHDDRVVVVRRAPSRANACVGKEALAILREPPAQFLDHHLVGAPDDDVNEITTTGDAPVDLARSGEGFLVRTPREMHIDVETGNAAIAPLLEAEGELLSIDEARRAAKDPKAFGLDKPKATARVVSLGSARASDGGAQERIELITFGEADGVTYARRGEDGAVIKLAQGATSAILPAPLSLRSKRVFDEDIARVRAVVVQHGDRRERLERSAESGGFRFVEPKTTLLADQSLTTELAEAVLKLRAERWVAMTAAKEQGLDAPRAILDLELTDEADAGARTLRVAIGAPTTGGAFARIGDDPAVFIAPRTLEIAASRPLVDRLSLALTEKQLGRVAIEAPSGKRVTLATSGGALHFTANDDATKAASVRDALIELIAERATSIGKPDPANGFDKPALTITVEPPDGAPIKITVANADTLEGAPIRYVRRSSVEATFAVAQTKLAPLFSLTSR